MAKIRLTRTQVGIVIIYILLVFAIGVVWAPWKLENAVYPASERHPLWSSPFFLVIDTARLFIELAIMTIILGGIFFLVSSKKEK